MFEVIFELIFELLFESLGELVVELGYHGWEKTHSAVKRNPVLGLLKYVVMGCLLGIISYWVLPAHFVDNEMLQWANRILSPLVLGFMLCLFSWFIKRKDLGEGIFNTDKFLAGVIFGAAYSVTRYLVVG